jgi:hypothetical protein
MQGFWAFFVVAILDSFDPEPAASKWGHLSQGPATKA